MTALGVTCLAVLVVAGGLLLALTHHHRQENHMPSMPDLALTCRRCDWRPGEDQQMQVVKDHFDAEHDGAEPDLDLTAFCPRDQIRLDVRMTGVLRSGRQVTTYDCPTCKRTYRVEWNGAQQ